MTAEDKFDEKFKYSSSTISLYREEIIQMMKEFTREKCGEQRENCADEYWEGMYCYHEILNAKEPEL